ncbi:MAG: folate-binding protein YgfZ [Acidobacteria bacterium]|nr:folate-binding protein YgfZ [Acidobacteriota bacterium]
MSFLTDEYRTILSGAGWAERRHLGHIRFRGRDVLTFLQSLVTNDVARLAPGQGAYAAYLTPQGRMVADLVLHRRDDEVVATVAAGLAASLASRFDQLVFSEDVEVADVSAERSEWLVVGHGAAAALAAAFELEEARLSALQELSHVNWSHGFIARAGEALLPSFAIVAPIDARAEVSDRLERSAMVRVSDGLVDALRIEAGRPRFGVDMNEDTIPLEAGLLERAISTTKGCYVGQEIVIRILHRGGGRVARRLLTFSIEAQDVPAVGAELVSDGKTVGVLTSVAGAPSGNGLIALGYVHRDVAETGKVFAIAGSPGANVVATGFAR